MKKNILYLSLIIVFIGSVSFIVLKYQHTEKNKAAKVYTLLERKGLLAKTDEWINTKRNVALLQNKIEANPADIKSKIALANNFILESK